MTLHLDTQSGSIDLDPLLAKIVPPELYHPCKFKSGDAKWDGQYDGLHYGVEVKHLGDIIRCISDGRFKTQLLRMRKTYDVYWLLIVDEFRSRADGLLEWKKLFGGTIPKWLQPFGPQGRHDFTYHNLISWLTTMELLGQCKLWVVQDNKQAAHWIYSKYRWSQKKKHSALSTFDTSSPAPRKRGSVRYMGKPNEIMCVLNALVPKIGWEKSRALSKKFNSVEELFETVRVHGWEELTTRGVGPKLAQSIVEHYRKKLRKRGSK